MIHMNIVADLHPLQQGLRLSSLPVWKIPESRRPTSTTTRIETHHIQTKNKLVGCVSQTYIHYNKD